MVNQVTMELILWDLRYLALGKEMNWNNMKQNIDL